MPRGFAHRFVILRERSDALRTALSFRTQSYVILNAVKNLFNNNAQNAVKNLVDPSLTLRMTMP